MKKYLLLSLMAALASAGAWAQASIPYSETFDTRDDFNQFNRVMVAGSRSWSYNASSKLAEYWSTTGQVDQWLISPLVELEAGKTYKLTFKTGLENAASSSSYKDLYVYVGADSTVAAQTKELFHEQIQSALMATKTAYFGVDSDGAYSIGFRIFGQSNYYSLRLDDIAIEESSVIPAKVADLTVVPDANGALAAALSFTLPTTDVAGNKLQAITSYEILRDGTTPVAATAQAVPGGKVEAVDQVPEAGKHTYTVTVTLDDQSSTSQPVQSAWIGPDTPQAPQNATLTATDDGHPQVTFTKVTQGINGGYVGTPLYTITRLPDRTVVASDLADSSFIDLNLPQQLASYSYSVSATTTWAQSEAATTNSLTFGDAITLPYTTSFADAADAAIWTVVDANADGRSWTFNSGDHCFSYTSMRDADDYLFTPPFSTAAGEHKLTFATHGYNYRYSDQFDVVLGPKASADGLTVLKSYEQNALQRSMFSDEEVTFQIPKSGIYYLGFHNVSTDSWGLYVGSTKIELVKATGVSETVATPLVRYIASSATLAVTGKASVAIYSISGRKVLGCEAQGALSLGNLPAGAYVATVTTANGTVQRLKFVK